MLIGIEFVLAVAAIAAGVAMFIMALRRRPIPGVVASASDSGITIMRSNLYALAVIALLFFGSAFLVDVFS